MSRILLTAIGSMAAAPVARRYQALGHAVFGCDIYPREWTALAGELDFFQARLATEGEPYVEQLREAVRRDMLDFLIPLTDPEVDTLTLEKPNSGRWAVRSACRRSGSPPCAAARTR